ncbi:HAMP domain-containing protein [Candidatus Sumerlaeota bacterium]|nr:HAMP domain-containing protein [Candidatus Sumerlaeota bacterium]
MSTTPPAQDRPNGPPRDRLFARIQAYLFRSSIRRKILGIIFISGMVPAIIVFLMAQWALDRVINAGVGQYLVDQAEVVARDIERAINREMQISIALSQEPTLRLHAQRRTSTPRGTILESLRLQGVELVTDRQGRPLAGESLTPTLENRLVQRGVPERGESLPAIRLLEDYQPGGGPGWLVFAVPIHDEDGHPLGMMIRRLSMAELVEPLLPEETSEFYLSVVNHMGIPVADRVSGQAHRALFDVLMVSHPGAPQAWEAVRTTDGQRQIVACSQVRLLSLATTEGLADGTWVVQCGFNLSLLLGGMEFQLWVIGTIALLAVFLFLWLGMVLTQRIVSPLRQMRAQVQEIAEGNLDQRVDVRTNDELQDLAQNVNLMAARLAMTLDDLESKIRMLRVQTDQLETLAGITRAITETLDRDEILSTFNKEMRRLIDFDALWVARIDPARGALVVTHSVWTGGESPEGLRVGDTVPLSGSRMGEAVRDRETQRIADLLAAPEPRAEDAALRRAGCRSAVFMALGGHEGVIGAVGLACRHAAECSPEQARLLAQAAEHLGIGIEHARLYDELRGFAEVLETKVAERTAELEQAHRRLIQTERFAATGDLAANVAHEINNPLGIIKNYLHMMEDTLRSKMGGRRQSDPNLDTIQVVREEIDRIARIVRGLLTFHRQPTSVGAGGSAQLNTEIDAILQLVEGGFERKGITLARVQRENLPAVACSPDLVRQVFLNLIRNAEDAMADGGGVLTITTALSEGPQGKCVIASVADTGHGISPEHMEKIFDPFFTTKEESGTGLGLSVTLGIMESIGGRIDVQSEPGRGATFTLTFPCES